jgi:hypothetical protein
MKLPRYLAVSNPAGKRWQAYSRDLAGFWAEHGNTAQIEVLPWKEVVPRLGDLRGLTSLDHSALVRLESPGRDAEVKRLLLRAGGHEPTPLADSKGHLTAPAVLHRGFCRVLRGLRTTFDAHPALTPLSCPLAIIELFDKTATAARLAAAGIPVPPSLPPPGTPAELLDLLRAHRWPVAYVKLNTGSSASGQAVVHALGDHDGGADRRRVLQHTPPPPRHWRRVDRRAGFRVGRRRVRAARHPAGPD